MSGIGAVYSIVGARRYDSEHVRFELDEARHEEWVTIIDRFKDFVSLYNVTSSKSE